MKYNAEERSKLSEKYKNHPLLRRISTMGIELKTDFKIKLFLIWKDKGSSGIVEELEKNGFDKNDVENGFAEIIDTNFQNGGFPLYQKDEVFTYGNDVFNSNPLVKSGKFTIDFKMRSLNMTDTFEDYLFMKYPDVSINKSLELAGLDPRDVGLSRINRLKKKFNDQRNMLENSSFNIKTRDVTDHQKYDDLLNHPYIKCLDPDGVIFFESFYNEIHLLSNIDIDCILEAYELPLNRFSDSDKKMIKARIDLWIENYSCIYSFDEQIYRIWNNRLALMIKSINLNFKQINKIYPELNADQKHMLVEIIDELPSDPYGYYTKSKILELIGIPKSTYYETLRNESYGRIRKLKDDEDFQYVKQVAEYKGYKKGYRQIAMMMKSVTGKELSPYRVLKLMRKYGLRSNIRKNKKSSKTLKAIFENNKKLNLLDRKFKLHRPNEVRLTDVTYLNLTNGSRIYGSASIDPVTSKLICFVVSVNNDLKLMLDTLKAMDEYPLKSGGIIHSDQGMLYFFDDFQDAVKSRDLFQSMSRRGNCWDNAPQESFFGHFKDECDYKKCKNIDELRAMIDDYRVYYNSERRLWNHDRLTPLEYEELLENMNDEEFSEYLKTQEAVYLSKKEKAAQKAYDEAKQNHLRISEEWEKIKNEKEKYQKKENQ